MRSGALGSVLSLVVAAAGCGYATAPSPTTAFSLGAGNYTLKISGSGFCGDGAGVPHEGTASVTVTRSGTAWSVRSVQTTDPFAMNFTTNGAATGSVQGITSGPISGASNLTINATGAVAGNNSGTNVAGGSITTSPDGPFGVSFSQTGGSSSCVGATWTLTPR